MKAYLKNTGVSGKLNMNAEGKVSMRDVNEGDNIWEQWTFDLSEVGHISNVAINYKVLDADDSPGATVKANDGQYSNPFQKWYFEEAGGGLYRIHHMAEAGIFYITADTTGAVYVQAGGILPTQMWQVVPV